MEAFRELWPVIVVALGMFVLVLIMRHAKSSSPSLADMHPIQPPEEIRHAHLQLKRLMLRQYFGIDRVEGRDVLQDMSEVEKIFSAVGLSPGVAYLQTAFDLSRFAYKALPILQREDPMYSMAVKAIDNIIDEYGRVSQQLPVQE